MFVSNAMKELCALLGLKRVSCIGIGGGKSSDDHASGSKVSVGENSNERKMIKEKEERDEVKEDSLVPSKQSQEGIEEDMRCAALDALSEYIRDKAKWCREQR